ncbi:MAG: peptidoglycan editing factor PgeF [Rhodobacteraceae bacterium]|nr:peptidoglycan editing factor PgeF [Paracoccaceae bacterium]
MITVDELSVLPRVRHGFFTRSGGGSTGVYRDNNCAFTASADDHDQVAKNRAACAARLDIASENLTTVKQKHTADVVTVDAPWPWRDAPVADALVTARPGVALGILTADCTPVLFADSETGVIAAAHAGWKGAFTGVVANTVAAMLALGARRERIVAAIGPCIAQTSYEVGPEFIERFLAADKNFQRFFTAPKANGHAHFDLTGFVREKLNAEGLAKIAGGRWDTCADDTQFFSYRRSILRKEPDYGRQLSAIALVGTA